MHPKTVTCEYPDSQRGMNELKWRMEITVVRSVWCYAGKRFLVIDNKASLKLLLSDYGLIR